MPNKVPTAHHQQQHDQQRGHEHEQGQPDVVPHLGHRRAAGSGRRASGASGASAAGAGRGKAPGRHGRRTPPGSAPRRRGGAGRRGGGHRSGPADRPTALPKPVWPMERGREAERGAPLPSHRSGEPGSRRPETPAAAGCASMAEAVHQPRGEKASSGTRGTHGPCRCPPEGPSAPGAADNVSRPRPRCFSAPDPPPCISSSASAPTARLLRGAGAAGRWSAELRGSLEEAAPRGLQLPECTASWAAWLLPPSRPSAFGYSQTTASVYRLRVCVLGTWLPLGAGLQRQSDFKHGFV